MEDFYFKIKSDEYVLIYLFPGLVFWELVVPLKIFIR